MFSPDSRFLALAGTQNDVLLCDLRPDGEARWLGIPVHRTSSLAFSADGATLAVAGDASNEILLWDVLKGRARAVLRGHGSCVQIVAFSPDGRSLASAATSEQVIVIWEVAAARARLRLDAPGEPVERLAFSQGGALLASASGRIPRIRLWDTASGRLQRDFGDSHPASHVAFSANGEFLATVGIDGTIRLWSVAKGETRNSLATQPDSIGTLAISSDGKRLATSGINGGFCLWNLPKIWRTAPDP